VGVCRFATTNYIITGLQTAAYIRGLTHTHTHTLRCTQKAEVAKNTKQLKPTNAAAAAAATTTTTAAHKMKLFCCGKQLKGTERTLKKELK